MERIKIFISYAHEDESYRKELAKHLKILEKTGKAEIWSDRQILAGSNWANEIDSRMKMADVILLLISADFINSAFCYDTEMKFALDSHNKGQAITIPIILRSCAWQETPLSKIQVLPEEGIPIKEHPDNDKGWNNVTTAIINMFFKNKVKARWNLDFNKLEKMHKQVKSSEELSKEYNEIISSKEYIELNKQLHEVLKTIDEMAMTPIRHIR